MPRDDKMRKNGFTLIELLIVLAVIAALISAMAPIGINAVKQAKATTVAMNLSSLSASAMSEFYLNHNTAVTLDDLKSYFTAKKSINDYGVKTTLGATVGYIHIWYKKSDVSASEVKHVLSSVVATDDGKPMVVIKVAKSW